jgi:hypothetical protein
MAVIWVRVWVCDFCGEDTEMRFTQDMICTYDQSKDKDFPRDWAKSYGPEGTIIACPSCTKIQREGGSLPKSQS